MLVKTSWSGKVYNELFGLALVFWGWGSSQITFAMLLAQCLSEDDAGL